MVSAASPATTQYDARQPSVWPSQVAAGTPTTLATGSPISTQGDGAAAPLGGDHARRHQRGDAEVAAVRQPVEESRDHQRPVVRGQGAQRVEQGVGRHQPDQQLPARQLGAEVGERGGADDHAQRVRRDDPAGHRDRHVDAVGDLGQHPHGHELGGADREAAHGKGHARPSRSGGPHRRPDLGLDGRRRRRRWRSRSARAARWTGTSPPWSWPSRADAYSSNGRTTRRRPGLGLHQEAPAPELGAHGTAGVLADVGEPAAELDGSGRCGPRCRGPGRRP